MRALAMAGAVFLCGMAIAQTAYDSLRVSLPKHYFQTVIVADFFRKPDKKLPDTLDAVGKRLKRYGFKQYTVSFYTPLLTKNFYGSDSTVIKNSHLLLTGNYTMLQPVFSGMPVQHSLVKAGIGLRYIYNTGKRGVWFADVSPFITRDATYGAKGYLRLSSTLIYSYNVSPGLNWRFGITKSFTWGNRLYLPFIGFRVGRLDKVNLSIQFPRSINFNVPVNRNLILSFYTSPQGGLYTFSNKDSIYFKNDKTFHLSQYQLNTGLRVDVRTGAHFNFYISTGICSRNTITFYSDRANSKTRFHSPYGVYFFSENSPATVFFNAGLVLRFGRAREFYNERNLYDMMDINNVAGTNSGNAQIYVPPRRQQKADKNLEAIQDLIDYNDF